MKWNVTSRAWFLCNICRLSSLMHGQKSQQRFSRPFCSCPSNSATTDVDDVNRVSECVMREVDFESLTSRDDGTATGRRAQTKHESRGAAVQRESWLVEQGLTSHSTQFRSFRIFLQVRWPNQQCQSTEGGWLVIQIALNLTRLISPCYNNTTCTHIQDNDTQRNLSTVSEPSEMKQNLAN